MQHDIINAINKRKIIAIVRGVEFKKLIPLAEALYNGGKRVLRVPESFLFEKYFGKNVTCLDDAACDNAAALGAVKIYECEIKG